MYTPNLKKFPYPTIERQAHWDTAHRSLVGRLLGVYACGPNANQMGKYDYPEFGWRIMIPLDQINGINKEAAARIEELESKIIQLESEIDDLYHQLNS